MAVSLLWWKKKNLFTADRRTWDKKNEHDDLVQDNCSLTLLWVWLYNYIYIKNGIFLITSFLTPLYWNIYFLYLLSLHGSDLNKKEVLYFQINKCFIGQKLDVLVRFNMQTNQQDFHRYERQQTFPKLQLDFHEKITSSISFPVKKRKSFNNNE